MLERLLPFDPTKHKNLSNPLWFLLALFVFIIFPAIAALTGGITMIVFPISYSVLVIIGTSTVADSRRVFSIGIFSGFSLLAFIWIKYSYDLIHHWDIIQALLFLMFFSFLFNHLRRTVLRNPVINNSLLYGVAIGYILLGVISAQVITILDLLVPGSFLKGGAELGSYEYFYYSFVTLTTLGYGDISPMNEAGEALAILIALIGQLYLALVVAIMVGKYLTTGKGI